MKTQLEFIGDWNRWMVYRNSDGFLEGYQSCGRKNKIGLDVKGKELFLHTDCKRIVTNAKTMQQFIDFVNGIANARKKKSNIPVDMPKLFNNDQY